LNSPKASDFVHGWRFGVRTLCRSRPRVARLVPLMGKATVGNISVPSRYCYDPKSPCYGLFVGCGKPARDPSFSLLLVLSACTVTSTIAGTSSSFPIIRPRLRPVMVLHYLCAWCPTPWIDVITGPALRLLLQMSAHMSSRFLSSRRSLIPHHGPCRAFVNQSFLLFSGSLRKGLGLAPVHPYELFSYVSEVFLS